MGLAFKDIRVPEEIQGSSFGDISGEDYRIYYYSDGVELRFEDPIALHVSESRGHRLILGDGRSVYVRCGWLAFEFCAVDDRAHWRF